VTNKVYVANSGSNNVTVIDGATNATTTVTAGAFPRVIAVNPVSNKVYVANQISADVTVIDGATNATTAVAAGGQPRAIAVNLVTNKVYVANGSSANVTVIDGATNTTTTVAAGTDPWAIAVNPVTNKVYAANSGSNTLTVITPSTNSVLPLTTAVSSSSMIAGLGNATGSTTPAFTFTVASTYAPTALAVRAVYYQVDSQSGTWTQATGAGPGPFTATLPAQAKGDHVLYAYAVDGLEGGAASGSAGVGSGNSPIVGSVVAYPFSVIDPVAQVITSFAPVSPVGFGTAPTTLTALGGGSGNAVVFATTSLNTICTVTGNVVTFVGVGTCNLTANQAGNANYTAAGQVTASIVIGQGSQAITGFTLPASVSFGAPPITLSANGGLSGNPVVFMSQTPTLCTTTGANGVTLTFLPSNIGGTCTVRASQAGNANYSAATNVDRSVNIGAAPPPPPPPPPSAPTNLSCTQSNGTITCNFDASTTSGGTTVASYLLYCRDVSGSNIIRQTSTTSPITLTGLVPRVIYTCELTAQSDNGASGASNRSVFAPQTVPLWLRNQLDKDGDGFADIYVRGVTPAIAPDGSPDPKAGTTTSLIGRFDGAKFTFTPTADVGVDWRLLGLGDIAGIGKSSLVSRNLSDNVRVDLTSTAATSTNSTLAGGTILRAATSDWAVESIIDLDGDGKADIVWRYMKPGTNDSGVVFAWYMDASTDNTNPTQPVVTPKVGEIKRRGGAPLSWDLIGGTDLNGDGKADLIWRSPTNELRSLTSTANREWINESIGQMPVGYNVQRLGDFNGDGKGDILFRDTEGRVKVWLMNGTTIIKDYDLPDTDKRWRYFASGDFNGDGTTDIAWQQPDGTLVVWLLNATNVPYPYIHSDAGSVPKELVPVEL
jgi:YVTN family beta-propeller protein